MLCIAGYSSLKFLEPIFKEIVIVLLNKLLVYIEPVLNIVYHKLFGVEKFCGFHGLIGNHKTFPIK